MFRSNSIYVIYSIACLLLCPTVRADIDISGEVVLTESVLEPPGSWNHQNWVGLDIHGYLRIYNGEHLISNTMNIGYTYPGEVKDPDIGSGAIVVDGEETLWELRGYVGPTEARYGMVVGAWSAGTLDIHTGATVLCGHVTVGEMFRPSAVTVSGAGTLFDISELEIGTLGTVNIENGAELRCSDDIWVQQGGQFIHNGLTLTARSLDSRGSEISGAGVINTRGLVTDQDMTFCGQSDLTQTFNLNGVTINLDLQNEAWILGVYNSSLTIGNGLQLTTHDGTVQADDGMTATGLVDGENTRWDCHELDVRGDGATLRITGGAEAVAGGGVNVSGTLNVDGEGTTLIAANEFDVSSYDAPALMNVSRGAKITSSEGLLVGRSNLQEGKVTIDGAGTTFKALEGVCVGDLGVGTLEITNGGTLTSLSGYTEDYDSYIGRVNDEYYTTTIGTALIGGEGSLWSAGKDLYVGRSGSHGSLTISDGGLVEVAGVTNVGVNGSITLDNGTLDTASLYASPGQILGVGTVNATSLAVDADVVYDSPGAATQQIVWDDLPGQNVTVNVTFSDQSELLTGLNGQASTTICNGFELDSYGGKIGVNAGSVGLVTVSGDGSTWDSWGKVYVGYAGTGTLRVIEGGYSENSSVYIGYGRSSVGSVVIDGQDSTWENSSGLYIGDSGQGDMEITGGATAISYSTISIGSKTNSSGTLRIADQGSSFECWGTVIVGSEGTGTLDIENGASVMSFSDCIIGNDDDAVGAVRVVGEGAKLAIVEDYCYLTVGNYGTGSLEILDGGSVACEDRVCAAHEAGSTARISVAGNGSLLAVNDVVYVGRYGDGEMRIDNGGEVRSAYGSIGMMDGSRGVVTVCGSGSTWTNQGDLYVGYEGNAALQIAADGLVEVGGSLMTFAGASLAVEVSRDNMLTVASNLTNDGTVRLSAGVGLAAGTYTPIAVTGDWTGAGAIEAFGGVWNYSLHTFTVADAAQATLGQQITIDLQTQQRLDVGDGLYLNFLAAETSTPLNITVTETSESSLDNLQTWVSLIKPEENVRSGYDFDVSGLPSGESVLLSFAIEGYPNLDDISVWYFTQTTGWTMFTGDLFLADGWVSFNADHFSSYALTSSVPEPAGIVMLAIASLILLARRTKRGRS